MAKRQASIFECQHCGAQSAKWQGKCTSCGAWDSFVELTKQQIEVLNAMNSNSKFSNSVNFGSLNSQSLQAGTNAELGAVPITQIQAQAVQKFTTYEPELDIVLGGGIAAGGLYLIGGSPGVGKSTLLLKISGLIAQNGSLDSENSESKGAQTATSKAHNENLSTTAQNSESKSKKVLYVSGEESASQIKQRAQRLNCVSDNLFLYNEIDLNKIRAQLLMGDFCVCVIDSIQTLYSPDITSAPGSISQVREITFALMRLAKEQNIAIFIIGHITKEGAIAGPRVLEHMVDCVLYFEGDPSRELRILRGFKNRFGSTAEIGIFELTQNGLVSAKDASKRFFSQRAQLPGSAVSVILEGSRALVIEIQALVSEAYGNPKRLSTGFDNNRLNMLLALLERKMELPLNRYDVFINVTGGIRIAETAADLAVIAAIISSFRNRVLNNKTAFLGEVSLVGDIRECGNVDVRLKELESYGFEKVILPKKPSARTSMKCFEAKDVAMILEWM